MTNIRLRVGTQLLDEVLRLNTIHGTITNAALTELGVVTFTIATPDAPPNATGMEPAFGTEWPSGRYFMTDPGWTFGGAQ